MTVMIENRSPARLSRLTFTLPDAMRSFFLLVTALLLYPLAAVAQDWALEGYDPVGYVAQGRPVPGRSDIATMWKGKIWHFASEDNRARFEADPQGYAPGFAGNCPVSLSEGRMERGDPRYFMVVGSTLYLMRSAQAQRQMEVESDAVLARAAAVWETMR